MNIFVEVERAGVVELNTGYSPCLRVNAVDMLELTQKLVDECRPAKDWNGHYAARVKIEVELLGDIDDAPKEE